ncbi:polyprenyl synthetase family protein [Hathewaya histolytica]|uniref:Farnesyl diphosphate synthase n=1 Tax=Hathewaya histolytica TaxID=1498 RepID=A0A4U9R9E0_HATHI|nr:farnesyl diphosphate synthase [Hathewaya histolytica]VTQ88192.1 geranyltranstransferase [Hathewaya histolytica]
MSYKLLKEEIDNFLKEYFEGKGSYNKIIYDAMSYSLNIGGKRIRPILAILTYKLYNNDYKTILPIAAAIEMIHTYSLVHDDLPSMDNDDLRRGKPTNHKVYGEAIAILAGDALLNEAFNIMISCDIADDVKLSVMNIISKAASAEGMIGGQVVDILSENKEIEKEELYYMHSKKTGELIKSSILAGAFLGKAEEKELDILREYGEKLGLVFQIIDDILDVDGDANKLGKNIEMDLTRHKTNFITIYGLEGCRKLAKEITNECFSLLDRLDKDVEELKMLTEFLLIREF